MERDSALKELAAKREHIFSILNQVKSRSAFVMKLEEKLEDQSLDSLERDVNDKPLKRLVD